VIRNYFSVYLFAEIIELLNVAIEAPNLARIRLNYNLVCEYQIIKQY